MLVKVTISSQHLGHLLLGICDIILIRHAVALVVVRIALRVVLLHKLLLLVSLISSRLEEVYNGIPCGSAVTAEEAATVLRVVEVNKLFGQTLYAVSLLRDTPCPLLLLQCSASSLFSEGLGRYLGTGHEVGNELLLCGYAVLGLALCSVGRTCVIIVQLALPALRVSGCGHPLHLGLYIVPVLNLVTGIFQLIFPLLLAGKILGLVRAYLWFPLLQLLHVLVGLSYLCLHELAHFLIVKCAVIQVFHGGLDRSLVVLGRSVLTKRYLWSGFTLHSRSGFTLHSRSGLTLHHSGRPASRSLLVWCVLAIHVVMQELFRLGIPL